MNCQFCRKPMKFSHHENEKEISVYDCLECPMLIMSSYVNNDSDPVKITFMFENKGKSYMWTNDRIKGYSYLQELKIADNPLHDIMLLKLPKLVDVTPENVIKKFSFYMVFA